MRYGATIFATDTSIDPVTLAVALEERGFDSFWVPEHTHVPVSRRTPAPMGPGELPAEYLRCVDPLVALAAVASRTTTLRLGTGIALVAQRDPIVTAKAVATLDLVAGGRVSLGIGFGWNHEEMEDHGVDPLTRRAQTREHVLAMRRLWEDDEATFDGEFVSFEPCWSWPKPIQRPLPVLVGGGSGPRLFEQVAEYAQGWIPIGGRGLKEDVPRLKALVAAAGRDPELLEIVPFGSQPDHAKLDHFEAVGVTECVFRLPTGTADEVLPILDRQAAIVAERA